MFRHARSMGIDKLKQGAINMSDTVLQANKNAEAIKEGNWKNVRVCFAEKFGSRQFNFR
jgi:hypothetical protein